MLAATQGASPFPRRTLNAGIATARLLGPHVLLEGRATDGVADSAVPQIRENVTRGPTPVKRFRAPFERSDHQERNSKQRGQNDGARRAPPPVLQIVAGVRTPTPLLARQSILGAPDRGSFAAESHHKPREGKAREQAASITLVPVSAQKIAEKFKPVPSTVAAVWSQLPMTRPPSTLTAWPVM